MTQVVPVVLYIEDNPLNIALVRKLLQPAGYRMLEAVNGKQGMYTAIRHRPDLVLMDLRLPDMNGVQVASHLRKHPLTKHAAIVALTAELVIDQGQWCKEHGFNAFLSKPVTRTTLLHAAQQWTAQAYPSIEEEETAVWEEATRPDLRHLEDTRTDPLRMEETRPHPMRFRTKPYHRQNEIPGS
jgi:CheY-like chemotaxis protein